MEQKNEEDRLTSLISAFNPDSSKWRFNSLVELLDFLRDKRIRRSDIIVTFGKVLLKNYASKLGDNGLTSIWAVREQVAIAALDVGDFEFAKSELAILKKKFPSSMRVKRLAGMLHEARGDYDGALALYRSILDEEKADPLAMKRCIAVQRAKGNYDAAIKLLNELLKHWMADSESWQELADLYLQQQNYSQVLFCYEELIVTFPENYHFYSKYAEVLYTIGGVDNIRLSKKYFAYSLELHSKDNLRAAYGLLLTCYAYATHNRASKKDQSDAAEMLQWVSDVLQKKYSVKGSARADSLNSLVTQLKG